METTTAVDITNALLDRYADAKGIRSNYAIAKSLGCTASTIGNYRNGKTKLDHTTAVQIAEELRIDPLTVIAKLTLERPHNPRMRQVWGKYSGRLLLAAVVALTPLDDTIRAKPAIAEATTYTLYALISAWLRKKRFGKWGIRPCLFVERRTELRPGRSPWALSATSIAGRL